MDGHRDARAQRPDPTTTASCLWAALHGLITLRQDRPSFPWPPLENLVRTLVEAHLAAAG
ncbi:hypothetical protein [Nocardia sp. NPDC020380]|uniref:hypothetical protein n=1 Tax=Nocardia sp. NPDC020380 TaxID=3364309 RepID=UPI0037B95108